MRSIKLPFCLAISILGLIPVLSAQQTKGAPSAPAPPQIAAAQKVFISNAGGESFESVINQTVFNGGPDRPYDQFYASMKSWGGYELVSFPADADLNFGNQLGPLGYRAETPRARTVAIGSDRSQDSRHIMEFFTQYVRGAMLLSNRDKNFDQAMTIIVNRLKILANPAAAPTAALGK